ncbi:MAG TPA: ABC transporter ATP-binding protein [bacterium]|nr:ABC transporter ATP-binding protein [bacterium]
MPVLEVAGLTKYFGGFRAVADLSFAVEDGEILGLVGPNGAGKTTTFNLITGFATPSAGRVRFRGEDVTGRPPHALARRGLVRTFQHTTVFARLSVEENVRIGCFMRLPGGLRATLFGLSAAERALLAEGVDELIAFTGLDAHRRTAAQDLAYGDQRTLEIAVALGASPRLLLLDEPFAGMNRGEAERCMALIHRTRERGVTILLVDHHMDTLMQHCDRLVVMHHGEKLAEGTPQAIRRHPEVIRTYLGGPVDA